tara:strand:- start:10009 stop:10827 length:819 start_codon:yes stop_codon:yes gene_type:complete
MKPSNPSSGDTTPPIIRLESITKAFGGVRALNGISLGFPTGRTTVVLGPSGCGKSVMLKHIIGLLRPDQGEVWFQSQRVDRMREHELVDIRRRVGFLFQQGALFDSMTVGQNIAFPLREHTDISRADRHERVDHMLELVGVPGTARRMPSELSGGQRKRIALARSIVLNPEVVLYDEPTTGLDPIRSDVIAQLILRLQDTLSITSIVVTHDITTAFKIADTMVMMNEGRILLQGDPDLFRNTDDDVIRRFLDGRASPEELGELTNNFEGNDS